MLTEQDKQKIMESAQKEIITIMEGMKPMRLASIKEDVSSVNEDSYDEFRDRNKVSEVSDEDIFGQIRESKVEFLDKLDLLSADGERRSTAAKVLQFELAKTYQ